MVAVPTGIPTSTATGGGSRAAGTNDVTVKVPSARMVGTLVAPTVGAPRDDRSVTTATTVTTTSIPTRGPFSLEELALFGFGHRNERSFDGVMRMAFRVDHDLETATGVEVPQQGDRLDLTVHGPADA